MENFFEYINLVTAAIAFAAAIAAITKTPKGDSVASKLYKILDCIALNIGHAKENSKKESEDKKILIN